jgi:hypothetical protein
MLPDGKGEDAVVGGGVGEAVLVARGGHHGGRVGLDAIRLVVVALLDDTDPPEEFDNFC